jgi:hypothetical protein
MRPYPAVPVLARFTSRAPKKVVPADQTPFYCDVSAEAVANAITRGAEGVSAASVVSYKARLPLVHFSAQPEPLM